jgi:inositol 1,4,5-triphosphate receptor type 1
VLLFFNERKTQETFFELMRSEKDNLNESNPIAYHINLVKLLATCTEGKNANTEIKCHSLLSLDDILRVVTHPDCMSEVSNDILCFPLGAFVLTAKKAT